MRNKLWKKFASLVLPYRRGRFLVVFGCRSGRRDVRRDFPDMKLFFMPEIADAKGFNDEMKLLRLHPADTAFALFERHSLHHEIGVEIEKRGLKLQHIKRVGEKYSIFSEIKHNHNNTAKKPSAPNVENKANSIKLRSSNDFELVWRCSKEKMYNDKKVDIIYLSNGNVLLDALVEGHLKESKLSAFSFALSQTNAQSINDEEFHSQLSENTKALATFTQMLEEAIYREKPTYGVILTNDWLCGNRSLVLGLRLLGIRTTLALPESSRYIQNYMAGYSRLSKASVAMTDSIITIAGLRNAAKASIEHPRIISLKKTLAGAASTLIVLPLQNSQGVIDQELEKIGRRIQAILDESPAMTTIILQTNRKNNAAITKAAIDIVKTHSRHLLLDDSNAPLLLPFADICNKINFIDIFDAALYHLVSGGSSFVSSTLKPNQEQLFLDLQAKKINDEMYIGKAKYFDNIEKWETDRSWNPKDELEELSGNDGEKIFADLIGIPDSVDQASALTNGRQRYICRLLGAMKMIGPESKDSDWSYVDAHIQFGAEPSAPKSRKEPLRHLLKRRKIIVEDGFIRGIGLWTNVEEPTHSLIIDTRSAYYDATRSTLLESVLEASGSIPGYDPQRASDLIQRIVKGKISKYNHAPALKIPCDPRFSRRILIVDQKAGDMSLKYGLSDAGTFERMLNDALSQSQNTQILIKQHPCAIDGGEEFAHYTRKSLVGKVDDRRVRLLAFDVNPYSLIEAVDEVWVATSGMGFEALLAGKNVSCYGAPFYCGWGVTNDKISIARRTKKRTLEEIFFAFYILLSRYVDPESGHRCEIEKIIEFVEKKLPT